MCQYMLFLSWKSVLLTLKLLKVKCSTIQVTLIVVEVQSYKDVCYFSIFYDTCQIWGRLGLGFGAIYMSLKRISGVLLQLLEMFDS